MKYQYTQNIRSDINRVELINSFADSLQECGYKVIRNEFSINFDRRVENKILGKGQVVSELLKPMINGKVKINEINNQQIVIIIDYSKQFLISFSVAIIAAFIFGIMMDDDIKIVMAVFVVFFLWYFFLQAI